MENQQEARRSNRKKPLGVWPSCSACHLTEGAEDGLSITCSKNQGSRDGLGRGAWLKLKVGKEEDLRGLIDHFFSLNSQIHN